MKKIVYSILFFCVVHLACAQFVQGIGIFAGGMASRHKYKDTNTPETFGTHRGKLIYRLCGGVVGDFFPGEHVKWRTEFEYEMKGSRETVKNTDGSDQRLKNKLDYISWNNFLKIQTELYSGFPYILIGPRVEYTFRNKPQAYLPVMNDLSKFHFSWSVGAGFEFMAYGPWRFFTEYHYNPDLLALYKKDNVKVTNITHELRVGLMYRIQKKTESCNAPIYVPD